MQRRADAADPLGSEDAPTRTRSRAAQASSVAFILVLVEASALTLILIARHFGVVADRPIWQFGAAVLVPSLFSRHFDAWDDVPRGSWRLHVRVAWHALTVMTVIYLTGWGPALGVCFVYSALVDLQRSGPETWRAILGWSMACCGLGQLLVAIGVMPTKLADSSAHALGFLGMFAFAIVIRIAGAIAEDKLQAEGLLAASEAHHRAVVEHAGEGIITVTLDGVVQSFNTTAERMFGWSSEEIVGRAATDFIDPAKWAGFEYFLTTVRATRVIPVETDGFELVGVRRDGTPFPMAVTMSIILLDGKPPIISCIARDLSEQKSIEERLAHQALHDALTGLPNRLMLRDRLERILSNTRRHREPCAVLYIDLDRFKAVNDSLGHSSGDDLLVEVAERILGTVRETDTVARLGGDEFVICCQHVHHHTDVVELAERVIACIGQDYALGDDTAHVGASIGIAISDDGNITADALLANADIAMYRAKRRGANNVELFDASMQEWVTTQMALEADLRNALRLEQFALHYQPIIATASGAVSGFEALLRWNRPGAGLVSPDVFIPLAEETGLIVDIGAWVLRQACNDAASWAARWPDRHIGVSVNISGRQLRNHDLLTTVHDALDAAGLAPDRLTLEITESSLIDDALATRNVLGELAELGANISLDDFGTGYSSLTYLRTFPITHLKIDKSFVRTVGQHRHDTAIVAAVLALARSLGLDVVAEGVENHQQLAVLLQLGCPLVQGYLFSPARPVSEVPALVEAPDLGVADTAAALAEIVDAAISSP